MVNVVRGGGGASGLLIEKTTIFKRGVVMFITPFMLGPLVTRLPEDGASFPSESDFRWPIVIFPTLPNVFKVFLLSYVHVQVNFYLLKSLWPFLRNPRAFKATLSHPFILPHVSISSVVKSLRGSSLLLFSFDSVLLLVHSIIHQT